MAERIHLIRIGYGYAITGSLTPADIGVAYSRTLTAIGGVGTKRLEIISENVTDAITFTDNGDNTATFAIADPQAAGTYSVTVRATDADRQRWTRTFTLDVVALPLTLSGSLADMTVGSAYSDTITVTGGVAPYEFYPIESFPAGITKSLAGGTASPVTVSGTPTGVGLGPGTAIPFTVTFIVQDAVGAQAIFSQSVTVNVAAVVCTIDGGALPDATVGVAYSHDVDATGGIGAHTFTKVAGPSWLSVNSSTGALTGTPSSGDVGTGITVTVRATDSEGNYDDVTDTIDVLEPAAPWDFSDLTNPPDLWLDDQSSISGSGSNVQQWSDRSGNGCHYAENIFPPQAVSAALNGYRVVRFNGTNRHLNGNSAARALIDGTACFWTFTVYKTNATYGSGSDRTIQHYMDSSGGVLMYILLGSHGGAKNTPTFAARRITSDSIPVLYADAEYPEAWTMMLTLVDFQNRTLDMWINGEHHSQVTGAFGGSGNSGGGTAAYARIGAGGGSGGAAIVLDGDIASVISGRDTLPDSDEIDKMFGKAAHYYGLTGLLDSGHPYKTDPPTV